MQGGLITIFFNFLALHEIVVIFDLFMKSHNRFYQMVQILTCYLRRSYPIYRVRLSASRGGIGTMRAASAPFFRHSETAIGAVAVFPCVTEKWERSRVPRIAGIGAAYSRCRL